jgi:small subunit ribosomal protein S4e
MTGHLKRLAAPGAWHISKKTNTYVTKTAPGPHNRYAMPVGVWLRDHMGLALTMREAKQILNARAILVNGKAVRDFRMGIGIFDIVAIPSTGRQYRITMDPSGYLSSREISAEEAKTRLCKIRNKTVVAGGKVQLNLLYGANILADNTYKPKDSVVVSLADENRFAILDHIPFASGNYAVVIGGRHSGRIGRIVEILKMQGNVPNRVILEDEAEKCRFDTIEEYTFMVGRDAAEAAKRGAV